MRKIILAQLVITGEGVAQGGVLASILAGFAFAGATAVRDRGTVVLYFAAGMLNTPFWWFAFYFFLAGAVWAPLLVGLAGVLGAEVIKSALLERQAVFIKALAAASLIYIAAKLIIRISTYKGRRSLLAKWHRLTRWEFWPPWAAYLPLIPYLLYLGARYRSLTLFTAANPGIPSGGFAGESKSQILQRLGERVAQIARTFSKRRPVRGNGTESSTTERTS